MPRSATELLDDLKQDGFTVSVIEGEPAVAPSARVTTALQAELLRHRDALMSLLSGTAKTEQPIPKTHAEIREAWAKLNAERERQAEQAAREAERRWVREHFEAARQQWEWEDEQGRRRAAEDLAEIFGDRDAWKYRRGY